MSAAETSCPAVTTTELFVSDPAPGTVVIFTAASVFAGESLGSVKPKSAAANVFAPSSRIVTVFGVPTGASFTDVTFTVIVFGDWSRSTPPPAVPPLSWTWNVNDAYPVPFAFGAGKNFNLPAAISVADTNCPAVTTTELFVSDPATGSVVIFTAAIVLAGESFGSENPKSAVAN